METQDCMLQGNEKRFFDDYYDKGVDAWEIFSDDLRKNKFYKRVDITKQFIATISHTNSFAALDIGCGEGFFDQHFEFDITGLDISSTALVHAKKNDRIKNPVIGNFISSPIKTNSFELVFLMESLYYHNPDKILSEVSRIIKPNGYLILSLGNKWDIGNCILRVLSNKKLDGCSYISSKKNYEWYEKRYSYFELKKLLQAHGFKILRYEGILLNIPRYSRTNPEIQRISFFLGSKLKLFSNQLVLLAQKVK